MMAMGFALAILLGLLAINPSPAYAATNWTVTTTGDTATSCAGTSCPTLRDAINAAASGDTIVFSASGTITLGSTLPTINKNLTINGAGQITIDGASSFRILVVNGGVTLSLDGLTVQNGRIPSIGSGTGAAILSSGTVTISNSTFSGNTTNCGGCDAGAIYSTGTVTISNSTFSTNQANGNGGAIYSTGTVTITNSTFSGNETTCGPCHGGAVYSTGTVNISDSTFSGNQTTGGGSDGGVIYNTSGTVTISNSTFSGNCQCASGSGGVIYNSSGTVTISNSTFSNTTFAGTGDGGAIYNSGTTTVTDSTFSGNHLGSRAFHGGAIYNSGTATITNSTFSGNTVPGGKSTSGGSGGGAIYNSSTGTATVTNSTFSSNSASTTNAIPISGGGAIYNAGTATITNSTFSGNSITAGGSNGGGGALLNTGTATVTNSILASSPTGGDCKNTGTFIVSGANLDDDSSCTGFTLHTNPQLVALANNGGPTETMALSPGSPAIDAVPAGRCTVTTDQRSFVRPAGTLCDIGAYEFGASAPTPSTPVPASNTSGLGQSLGTCALSGIANTVQVRAIVPANIATTGNIPVNICFNFLTDPVQIGVIDRPITLAVEVIAYTKTDNVSVSPLIQPITVCLSGSGSLLYRDATGIPRVVTTLSAYSQDGFTCGSIPNAGTVILVNSSAAPAAEISTNAATTLAFCPVTTTRIVNLRGEPNTSAQILNVVPYNIVLHASAKSGDWYQVVFENDQGWINAQFLNVDASCGQ